MKIQELKRDLNMLYETTKARFEAALQSGDLEEAQHILEQEMVDAEAFAWGRSKLAKETAKR